MSIDMKKYNIDFERIKSDIESQINENKDIESLTNLWRKYLGKDGVITTALKEIRNVVEEDRKEYGQELNRIKVEIDKMIESAKRAITEINSETYLSQKLTKISHEKGKVGHLHPLTQTTRDMNEIFSRLGYSILDGPEIESDEYCFQRLNLPLDHPARDLQDSIYIEKPNVLLRTQTSSIEARALEMFKPPFKVVMPGRVYRNEKVSKSNHFTFHQYQLTVVKEKVSMSELFSTINHLFKTYYGDDVEIRFRCKYYPEVEPGVGPDMKCFNCKGSGVLDINEKCQVCKGRGWIEMGGAGIIHPNVLRMAGLDPEKWQGYAFGMGLDRWAMAKHKISDIRTLLGGNLAYMPNVS